MNKRRKRVVGMGVLLIVFVLGFTGCDWLKSILGMEEDDPKETPGGGAEPKVHLTLYVSGTVPETGSENSEKVPDGTEGNPFPTVAAALEAVAKAYDDNTAWQADVVAWQKEVTEWQEEESESKSPPNPGKAISAEIVLLSPVTVDAEDKVITIPAPGGTTYPPLILSAQNPVSPEGEDRVYAVGDITLSDSAGPDVSLLMVGKGVTLTLRNITLKGTGGTSYYSLVTVGSGGNLILADKAVIYDHSNSGVQVKGGGTFIMSGGEIRDNNSDYSGGGVYVERGAAGTAGGTFIMSGGEIWGNSSEGDGGGVFVQDGDKDGADGGTFTMSGGVIRGNSAKSDGGGVFVQQTDDAYIVHFAKTGTSVIYGDEDHILNADNKTDNTAFKEGNAVWVGSESGTGVKKRDSTAEKDVDLYWPLKGNDDPTDGNWDSQP